MKILTGQVYQDGDKTDWEIEKKSGRGEWDCFTTGDPKRFRKFTLAEIKNMQQK